MTYSISVFCLFKVQAVYGESDNVTLRSDSFYVNTSVLLDKPSSSIMNVKKSKNHYFEFTYRSRFL